ncbi:MAG: chromosome segregation protein SMC [Candidatus Micrarchaeota archaeon]|nr:chromosome segregation protein SMC [Candidatus Micrarchaeota archaeon]
MLYLKSMSLSRFKSFKQADLLFSKGFTCIVGPNGSGKSNICDALLFSLGEGSLRRMRADRLQDLITSGKGKGSLPKTFVKTVFEGDDRIEVVRAARADGKSLFKVNGKKMTRAEVREVLKSHNINVDETSTITQGEINMMMNLNPQQRRELIDIAAGIKEFEAKKAEALKELDKVNAKASEANMVLGERLGFLKELEKEKAAAESFSALTNRLKILKYSVLAAREAEISQLYEKHSKELAAIDAKKQKIVGEMREISANIDKLAADRQKITKELGESTTSSGQDAGKLEEANKELALIGAALETNAKQLAEKQEAVRKLREESETLSKNVESNKKQIAECKKVISEIEPKLKAPKEERKQEGGEEKMESLNAKIKSLEEGLGKAQNISSALQADLAATKGSISDNESRAESLIAQIKERRDHKKEFDSKIGEISKSIKKLDEKVLKADSRLQETTKEIGEIDEKITNLKEQRALGHSREVGISEKLSGRFSEKEGFYGRVSQLCTYANENSMAVESSAGARFDYFVVDDIESASKVIGFLKKNDLGRATFIPIKDLSFERSRREEKELKSVLEVLKFDSKFSKVFDYVFGNTYILESVEDSKKYGVGKHRYVTLSGELVEQSGVLSGGSAKRRASLASIENQLKECASQKEKLRTEQAEISGTLYKDRKERALLEMESVKLSSSSSSIEEQLTSFEIEEEKSQSIILSQKSKVGQLEKQISENAADKQKIEKELSSARELASEIYRASIETAKSIAKHGMSKEEKERIESLRAELDEAKARSVALQTETSMSEKRISDIENQMSDETAAIVAIKADTKGRETKKISFERSKSELEEKIKGSSASSKKRMEKAEEIDSKIRKAGEERGRAEMQNGELDRQLGDLNVKRGQLEVRLGDIKAELATYPQGMERISMKIEEMEHEANVASAKIETMGNVNLKAPEMYEAKKRDVGEAQGKLETLTVEKDAIMKMIEEIDSKKLKIFMDTFETVNKNFMNLYSVVFPEKATLELDNPKEPFESGIRMKIPDGKGFKREKELSGGEKSLRLLVLLFAIHMHKPSSLYVFDEVDAALDKENSKKLSHLLKEMSKNSQFIVVSHNDSLIVNSDTAIGVAKTDGESRAVGLQVANIASNAKQPGA